MTRVVFVVMFCALIAQATAEITSFKLPKTTFIVGERVQIGWEFNDESDAQSSVLQINIVPEGGNFATDTVQDLTVDEHAKRIVWHVDVPPDRYYLHALGADSDVFDVVADTNSSDANSTDSGSSNGGEDSGDGNDDPSTPNSGRPDSPGQGDTPVTTSTAADANSTDTKGTNTALVAGIVVVAAIAICGLGIAGYLALRMRSNQQRLVSDILAAREEGLGREGKGGFADTGRPATPDHPQTGQPMFGSR